MRIVVPASHCYMVADQSRNPLELDVCRTVAYHVANRDDLG